MMYLKNYLFGIAGIKGLSKVQNLCKGVDLFFQLRMRTIKPTNLTKRNQKYRKHVTPFKKRCFDLP